MNCPRRHMCWQRERGIWKGRSSGEHQGQGTQRLLCLAARSLRIYQAQLVSRLSVASHLALPKFDLTQGPSWGRMPLSVRVGSSTRVSGRLAGHIMGYCLLALSGPSQILPIGFVGGSSVLCSLLGPHVARHLIQAPSRQFWSTVP